MKKSCLVLSVISIILPVLFSMTSADPLEACNAVGGSAFRIAVTGKIVEFSGPGRTSPFVGGIIVRVVSTDTFIITEPDGSFVVNDLVLNRVVLSFERGTQKATLDLGLIRQSQVINLGDVRVRGSEAKSDYKKVGDFWERWILGDQR